MTAFPLGPGDLFLCAAGPGELATASALCGVARSAGARGWWSPPSQAGPRAARGRAAGHPGPDHGRDGAAGRCCPWVRYSGRHVPRVRGIVLRPGTPLARQRARCGPVIPTWSERLRFAGTRPAQLRSASEAGTPFVPPIGVMEVSRRPPAGRRGHARRGPRRWRASSPRLLPPFAYGAASHAVAGPEGTGNLHVDASALVPFAEGLFMHSCAAASGTSTASSITRPSSLRQGMPTDLAFRLAARNAIFRFLEGLQRGTGWWGDLLDA